MKLRALLLVVAIAGVAHADTVVLRDGRRLQGRSSTEGDEVVVRRKHGEVRVPRADVLRIEKEDDVYAQHERKAKELGQGTADERYALGVWSRENGLDAEARNAFLSVLKLDPDHLGARAALGYVKEDGRWITEDDRMRSKGFVRHEGRWMTPEEKGKLEAAAAEKRARARELAKKLEEDKVEARRKKAEAEREARRARIQAYEEELARARARQRARDEAEPVGFGYYSGFVGPYGFIPGRSYYVGPSPSFNDQLAYAGYLRGVGRYPSYANPTFGRVVTVNGGGCYPYYYGGGFGTGFSTYGYGSYSSFGIGAQIPGSYTSRSGRTQIRFRTGF